MDRPGRWYRILCLTALVVGLCGGDPALGRSPDDEYTVAAGHYQARRWDLAVEAFQQFARQFPDHELAGQAQFYEAEARAQLGQFREAAALLDRILRDDQAGDMFQRALFRRGEAAYLARDFAQAEESLDAFRRQFPEDELMDYVLVYLGDVYTASEKHEAAEAAYRAGLERLTEGPLALACRRGLARAVLAQGKLDEAQQHLSLLAESDDAAVKEQSLLELIRLAMAGEEGPKLERLASEFLRSFPASSHAAAVRVALAESQLAQGDCHAAIEAFRAALGAGAVGRVAAQCHAGLAVCHATAGAYDEASRHLVELSSRYLDHWDVAATKLRVAELAYTGGAREVAADLFREVSADAPSPELAAKALAGLAWAQLRQEDLRGSADTFERLVERYPNDPRAADAGLLRAQILDRRGQQDAALALYRRVIDELAGPELLPQALYLAARLHDRLHQAREARELYERLIEDHAAHAHAPSAMYHLGWVLEESGQRSEACNWWQAIHERGPSTPHWRDATYLLAEDAVDNDAERAWDLIQSLIGAYEQDEASAAPRDGAAAVPEDSQLYVRCLLLAAQIAMDRGEWQEARDYVARILDVDALDDTTDELALQARFWTAEADYRLSRFDEAAAQLEQLRTAVAGRDDGWIPFVPLRRAQILAHQRQWPEASQAAQDVLDQYPQFPLRYEADYVLGRSRAALGEFDAAREAYGRVLDSETGGKTETAAMAQWMIGESYLHQQQYDHAVRAYLRGEILFPYPEWQARSLLQAGKCYEHMNDWQSAEATYGRLVERFPNSSVDDEVRARLEVVSRQAANRRP